MEPEGFAQKTAGAIAHNSSAHFTRGDDAEARPGFGGQAPVIGDEAAIDQALAFLPDASKVAALLDALSLGETAARWRVRIQTGVRRLRPTRRRLRKMARPLLVELRLRKPCCRLRRIFEGWYCRFINHFAMQALSNRLIDNTPLTVAQGTIEGPLVKLGWLDESYSRDCQRTLETE